MVGYSEEELAILREKIQAMARKAELAGEPLAWFEELYDTSEGDDSHIPWSDGEAHQFLVEWTDANPARGRALVVGCGLGEDAAHLARAGWKVTAFDLSPTAIEWSARLHQDLDIEWRAENLLDLPTEWTGAWDLVLEVHILQAMPPELSARAAPRLAPLLAPGGNLVCIGRINLDEAEPEGPPWPLRREFIEGIGEGLEHTQFDIKHREGDEPKVMRYISVWKS